MSETSAEQEPSIEEILESIRQIISEDGEEASEGAKADSESGEVLDISAKPKDKYSQDKAVEVDLTPKADAAANDKAVEVDLTPKADAAANDKAVEVDLTPKADAAANDKAVEVDLTPKADKLSAGGDDVLDLTEVVNSDSAQDESANTEEAKDMDKSSIDSMFDEAPAPAAGVTPAEEVADNGESLISGQTADAATEALSKLLATNIAIEREYDSRVGKVTLEDMARDLMKPIIKTWLDQNLPEIIEKVVQKEVEKLSRRALDK